MLSTLLNKSIRTRIHIRATSTKTEPTSSRESQTIHANIGEYERQQIKAAKLFKEFSVRRQRRKQGIMHDEEELLDGQKVRWNYIGELRERDKTMNSEFKNMFTCIIVVSITALSLFMLAKFDVIRRKKAAMRERELERAKKAALMDPDRYPEKFRKLSRIV